MNLTERRARRIARAMQDGAKLSLDGLLNNREEDHDALEWLVGNAWITPGAQGRYRLTPKGNSALGEPSDRAKQSLPMAAYLGTSDLRDQRLTELRRICEPYGGISRALQRLADGELELRFSEGGKHLSSNK